MPVTFPHYLSLLLLLDKKFRERDFIRDVTIICSKIHFLFYFLAVYTINNHERYECITAKVLKSIGHALGIGRHVIRQQEAFEYVMECSEKTLEELAVNIIEKGQDFSEKVESAASRIASYIYGFHKKRKDNELVQKWSSLFTEEEFHIMALSNSPNKTIYFHNYHLSKQQKIEFSLRVIRNAVHHYLEDIKYFGKTEYLSLEELKILNQIRRVQKSQILTPDERQIHELWKSGFLQCDFIVNKES